MKHGMASILACALALIFVANATAESPEDKNRDIRARIMTATGYEDARKAYAEYFRLARPEELKDRMADKDTGIALHAAWEFYKRPEKRSKPIPDRGEHTYNERELVRFRDFVKERTKTRIPDWWGAQIIDVDVSPGNHHCFAGKYTIGMPRILEPSENRFVQVGAELQQSGNLFQYTANSRSISFPAAFSSGMGLSCYIAVPGETKSIVAAFCPTGGYEYRIAQFANHNGESVWKNDVWAAGRFIGGLGIHRVELVENATGIVVFGAESHGMYMEAFDTNSGRSQYRFCTAYWHRFSESWVGE